ncbi:GspE/PulE family protein [Crassaminicella profunda]|uniref:GspE/PulE family protein n=1 Tax=Crassaminicella profunda TaxID=1286698 RepID=UPI001FEBE525|nr:GspE/PulE family protein [Crassaminicella profunda]
MFEWESSIRQRLGELLIQKGKLSKEELDEALYIQVREGKKIGQILVEKQYVTVEDILDALSIQLNIEKVNLSQVQISDKILKNIPIEIAQKYDLIPFDEQDGSIYVAMSDPDNLLAVDDVRLITGKNVKKFIASGNDIKSAIERSYKKISGDQALEDLKKEYGIDIGKEEVVVSNAEVDNAPAVRLANSILSQAIEMKASDIHIEPFEEEVLVRYRIDGALMEHMVLPQSIYDAVSTRFKIIGSMDIAEKRIPQDGRIAMEFNGKDYDFRVSSLPTVYGEKIVMRILDKNAALVERAKLGFTDYENKLISRILKMPNGILLVTGPTGSGKTTTLYSFLSEMNTPDKNIITIEDPVEYMLNRINQVQVNSKAGLTFAAGLRSMLRQDPDVIMLGEIRDEETAQIAVRASITGHFVLSTLHTNDAPSSITRLIDMGIESYLAADAVVGIIAQRLVRRLCPHCKESYTPDEGEKELLKEYGVSTLYRAKGCKECNDTGYAGRRGIHEVLMMDIDLRNAIETGKTSDEIREIAIRGGMMTLFENCKTLVLEGETTTNELVKTVHGKD